jgi:hypothetical protein
MTAEEGRQLTRGDIVQIGDHPSNPAFTFCLMVVNEVKSWGVQGYVPTLGTREEIGGRAYYRAAWNEIEATGGKAAWIAGSSDDG